VFEVHAFGLNALGIVAALLYIVARGVQVWMSSHRASDWLKRSSTMTNTLQTKKNVVVIVSSYKSVHPKLFESIANQRYTGKLYVIVVDDGSPNCRELQKKYYRKYTNHPRWTFIYKIRVEGETENGKKRAQQTAIAIRQWNENDLVLFLDADSYLASDDTISSLVLALEDPKIGGVGARLGVANPNDSWVTKFLVEEYNQTFRAKAVESLDETVTVVSGACSMWKWKVIDEIFKPYLTGPATGDENTLSYLALKANHGTAIVPAVTKTDVPNTLRELVDQQVRWLRSDCLYIAKNFRLLLNRKKGYLLLNMTVELFAPLLLLFTAVSCGLQWVFGAGSPPLQGTFFLLFMMAFDAVSAWRTAASVGKEKLRFSLLYPVHVLLFSLFRIWAFLTCKREVWISR
jgi:cellulose synthase/poly-beta-1,6-N-acetylglucosamine synthase-like glycosyltransferase